LHGRAGAGQVVKVAHAARPGLPDARTLRRIIRDRQARGQHFARSLFADPAWDMLLDLTAARVERRRVSISSLCLASGVPSTTALRWIRMLEDARLIEREVDVGDRRRSFVVLTDTAALAMARYLASIGAGGRTVI